MFSDLSIERYFNDIKFPTDKQDLINKAKSENLSDLVISALKTLPDDQQYFSLDDLLETLAK